MNTATDNAQNLRAIAATHMANGNFGGDTSWMLNEAADMLENQTKEITHLTTELDAAKEFIRQQQRVNEVLIKTQEQAIASAKSQGREDGLREGADELERAFAEASTYNLLHGAARLRSLPSQSSPALEEPKMSHTDEQRKNAFQRCLKYGLQGLNEVEMFQLITGWGRKRIMEAWGHSDEMPEDLKVMLGNLREQSPTPSPRGETSVEAGLIQGVTEARDFVRASQASSPSTLGDEIRAIEETNVAGGQELGYSLGHRDAISVAAALADQRMKEMVERVTFLKYPVEISRASARYNLAINAALAILSDQKESQ